MLSSSTNASSQHSQEAVMTTAKRTVLLVEDDVDLRETLSSGLSAAGYAVIETDNVESALTQLRARKVFVVILDLVLTGTSGAALLGYIKTHPLLKNINVIMMSGYE